MLSGRRSAEAAHEEVIRRSDLNSLNHSMPLRPDVPNLRELSSAAASLAAIKPLFELKSCYETLCNYYSRIDVTNHCQCRRHALLEFNVGAARDRT